MRGSLEEAMDVDCGGEGGGEGYGHLDELGEYVSAALGKAMDVAGGMLASKERVKGVPIHYGKVWLGRDQAMDRFEGISFTAAAVEAKKVVHEGVDWRRHPSSANLVGKLRRAVVKGFSNEGLPTSAREGDWWENRGGLRWLRGVEVGTWE